MYEQQCHIAYMQDEEMNSSAPRTNKNKFHRKKSYAIYLNAFSLKRNVSHYDSRHYTPRQSMCVCVYFFFPVP